MYTSVFDLAVAMNEAVSDAHSGGNNFIPDTVDLPVDLTEATNYMDFIVANEAANFVIMSTNIDEVMTEAALYHNEKVVAMNEASFQSVKESVIGFFKKILGFISGILARIEEFLAKFVNKTDTWAKLIKPRLAEAKANNPDFNNIEVNMHDWDREFILKTMPTGIASMAKFQNKSVDEYINKNNIPIYASTPDEAAFRNLEQFIEHNKEKKEEDVKAVLAELKIGNVTATTIDEFWKKVDEAAKSEEKANLKIASKEADAMLAFVEGSKAAINQIKNGYKDAKATISSRAKEWEAAINQKGDSLANTHKEDKIMSSADNKYNVKYAEAVKSCASAMITRTNVYSSVVNGLQKRNINYIKTAASEYMTAITKLASKGKKADKAEEPAPAAEGKKE